MLQKLYFKGEASFRKDHGEPKMFFAKMFLAIEPVLELEAFLFFLFSRSMLDWHHRDGVKSFGVNL